MADAVVYVSDLAYALNEVLDAADNVMISGAPGIGKSEITYEVCKKRRLKMLEVRLYEEGESAAGLPLVKNEVTCFTKPEWFHELETNSYNVVFFDDFHLVVSGIQAYLYRFLTSRMLHHYKIHRPLKVIVAGNFAIESASACEIQSPIMSRFNVFLNFVPSIDSFLSWAKSTDRIHSYVYGYLKLNPEDLYTADPQVNEMFPCPRAWETLSKFGYKDLWKYAPSIVGSDVGSKFLDFLEIVKRSLNDLLKMRIDNINQAVRCAIGLSNYFINSSERDRKRIMEKVLALHDEAQFLFAKFLVDKHPTVVNQLLKYDRFVDKIISLGKELV